MDGVLVTGGAGRLGQLVVHELSNEGVRLVSLDKLPWDGPRRENVAEVVGDLLDPVVAGEAMEGVDVVVHLAAELLPVKSCLRTNQVSTWTVLSAAVDRGVRRVVYASSVYAFGHHWGFTREQYPDGFARFRNEDVLDVGSFPITEESAPAPRDPYSVSKLLNEQTAAAVTRAQGLETVGLRFGDIWFDALQTWWKDPPRPARPRPGEKFDFWNYVDAIDAARAVAAAVAVDTVPDPLVVFVTADDTQVREDTRDALASSFPELLDRVPADLQGRTSLFSNRRARETLGWSPRVSWTDFEPS